MGKNIRSIPHFDELNASSQVIMFEFVEMQSNLPRRVIKLP